MQNTNRVYIAAVAGLFFAFAPSVWAQVPVRALRNGLKAAQRTGAELVSPWTKVKISLPTPAFPGSIAAVLSRDKRHVTRTSPA